MGLKYKSKKVYKKNKRNKCKITRRKKVRFTRRRYLNKKRVTRSKRGGMDPPPKKTKEKNLEQELRQATPITRLKIEKLKKFGYEIDFDTNSNKWIILNFPEILFPNKKLPYLLRNLSSNERENLFDLLMSNPDEAISDHLVDVFNEIIYKNTSGCDLEKDTLVEQNITNGTITAAQIGQYRGKIGTIVTDQGNSIDITDGMKSVANVRVIVPMELPQAITRGGLAPLKQGLYKFVINQRGIMIAPSNCVNFSMIKYYGLKYLDPPTSVKQNIFFVNMDKILPKVRLLASFGYGDIYDEWITFLQTLGSQGITWETITVDNIPVNNFQSSPQEIMDWIKDQLLDLSKYIDYPGWEHTCLTISEISHPCLNQGIQDVSAAGEFCVICDAEGNCYIVKVTTYSGHYHPPEILLPLIRIRFNAKGYTNLIDWPQHQCLAISEEEAIKEQNECPPYDPTALLREAAPAPFTIQTPSQDI